MKLKKIVLLIILLIIPKAVSAASFNLGASSRTVTVGSNVTIYVNGSDITGKVNVTSSNTSVLSSGTNTLWIEPNGQVTFNAKKVGSATITVSAASLSDGSGNDVNLGSKSITINVVEKQAPKTVSSNNSLKNLTIEGFELEPSFEPGTTEYDVNVTKGTEKINILATAEDNKASINGTGEIQVSEGLNILKVIVTAENGYQKEYKLNVTVEEEPITVKVDEIEYNIVKQSSALPQASSYYTLSTMEYKYLVEGEEKSIEIPIYTSEVTGYTLIGLKDNKGSINLYIYKDNKFSIYNELSFNSNIVIYQKDAKKIPNGYKKTKVIINDQEIIAYQKEKNEFYLIYGQNVNTNEIGWYKYDKTENSIQKYDSNEIDVLEKENHKYLTTIYVLCITSSILLISIIVLLIKTRNTKR